MRMRHRPGLPDSGSNSLVEEVSGKLDSQYTVRVVSHGCPATLLQSTAQTLQGLGPVNRITFAHGTSPFTHEQLKQGRAGEPKGWNGHGGLKDLFLHCWRVGLIEQGATGLLDQDLLEENLVSCCPRCRKANFCTPALCISALG